MVHSVPKNMTVGVCQDAVDAVPFALLLDRWSSLDQGIVVWCGCAAPASLSPLLLRNIPIMVGREDGRSACVLSAGVRFVGV
jgi:hypothetical protein